MGRTTRIQIKENAMTATVHHDSTFHTVILWIFLGFLAPMAAAQDYGSNKSQGGFIKVNDISMYYEVYGEGPPLVLIHGSGQSIIDMAAQIDGFRDRYQIIVADSRAHGKSGMTEQQMTYRQMATDWASLIAELTTEPVRVIGWSDGGNIALELARAHSELIDRVAVMGANLAPDESAVYPWAVNWVLEESANIEKQLADGDTSQNWAALKQQFYLLRELPDMTLEELSTIQAPVLVMAGDRDIIREEHTLLIYQTLPNAHLAIFPGETHFTPATDPELFNRTVDRFMDQPFTRPDSKTFIFGDDSH
ncbi:MAG: alpha/beta hydrolase [Cellvibrionales bacterium]|nr:alpha/beta hydrolase [Cellvibrionales bacterium]